jgi:superfamily II DNA/RNA helicase
MLSVLLPSTGAEPIKALHAFRDRVASLLLATPSAARGLDLPAVSHVYSLGLPPDATEYVHRAGRAGRIGSTAGGEVCTVLTREELPALQQMVEQELGLELECVELDRQGLGLLGSEYDAARQELLQLDGEVKQQQKQGEAGMGEEQLENARKGLEDLFNLL